MTSYVVVSCKRSKKQVFLIYINLEFFLHIQTLEYQESPKVMFRKTAHPHYCLPEEFDLVYLFDIL